MYLPTPWISRSRGVGNFSLGQMDLRIPYRFLHGPKVHIRELLKIGLERIWHENMPYNKIADRKGHQGWMKRDGPYFLFPGGGTMFPDGATQYIAKLKQYIPISGGSLRTALDMGCG
ncbi:probable methyltransferase PMT13, partial [Tanacetum coccineum]